MARITIEDCLAKINNHFELTLTASCRARQLENNALPMIDDKEDKSTVIALKEIALGKIDSTILEKNYK